MRSPERETVVDTAGTSMEPLASSTGSWRRLAPVAAAAALVLAAAVPVLLRVPLPVVETGAPVHRTPGEFAIRSLVRDGEKLPSGSFVLRWAGGPDGTRYVVRVTDRHLRPIAGGRALTERRFTVPERSLEGLERGDMVFWQVEAILPDGRQVASDTFTVRIE